MTITEATITETLQGSTLPVAVWNDGGTYKLWTPALLPGTEPDGLLIDVADDLTGTISENGVDEADINDKTATVTVEFQSNNIGEQTERMETTSDADGEALWDVTAEAENRYDTGFSDDIGKRATEKILFQDRR